MISRRRVLIGLGAGLTAAGIAGTSATDLVEGDRNADTTVVSDEKAYVGMNIQDSVKKNSRDPLIYYTNNVNEAVDVTVSLQTCSEGTLYDPEGDSGCTVTSTISAGNQGRFDLEASVSKQYVDFNVDVVTSASADFVFKGSRRTYAQAGETKDETWIKKLQGLTAREIEQDWTIKDVKVEDVEGTDNLDRVEFVITKPDGTVVGEYTADCSDSNVDCQGGAKYQPKGNPSVEIESKVTHIVDSSITYTVTVTAYDKDGNSDSDTLTNKE